MTAEPLSGFDRPTLLWYNIATRPYLKWIEERSTKFHVGRV
jgi:hypothetical protein